MEKCVSGQNVCSDGLYVNCMYEICWHLKPTGHKSQMTKNEYMYLNVQNAYKNTQDMVELNTCKEMCKKTISIKNYGNQCSYTMALV